MDATRQDSARLWQRRSRATRSRWRSRDRAFWRGVHSTSGPPGLTSVEEEEQQEEKEDQSEFLEERRLKSLDNTHTEINGLPFERYVGNPEGREVPDLV